MSKILISYRREDSADITGRIYDRLVQQFGREAVFKDVDSIPLGVDFRKYLDEQVAQCDVFLAVIGRKWMKTNGRKGKSRLDEPGDFVRIEVESALKRNIPIIPVLVGGASIPSADRLPASIQELPYRNGIAVRTDPDFHRDMDRLIHSLKLQLGGSGETHPKPDVLDRPIQREASPSVPPAAVDMTKVPRQTRGFSVPQPKPESPAQPVQKEAKPSSRIAPVDMVKVPKGLFLYGDEQTPVTIDHDYWIDQYPVTNEKYRAFIEADGYGNKAYWSPGGLKWMTEKNVTVPEYWNDATWNEPDHPVVGVSYYEAEAYAKWAGKRLPTEQEWEKAARGEDGRRYPWGEEFDRNRCNSYDSGINHTTPVSQYSDWISPYGCYDMAGNVWEWCSSWYNKTSAQRVLRGGFWGSKPVYLRTSNRYWINTDYRNNKLGFRLVQDIS